MAKKKVVHEVWVQPRGVFGWKLTYDGAVLGTMTKKSDAVNVGRFIAKLMGTAEGTELYVANRSGEIVERSTFPRSADPKRSKG